MGKSSRFASHAFVSRAFAAFAVAAALVCSGFGVQSAMASPEGHTVVISASDFQSFGGNSGSVQNVNSIIATMKGEGIDEPDGLVFAGDFNVQMGLSSAQSNESIDIFKSTINAAYPSIGDNMALSAGNHEQRMDDGINVSPYGPNDTDRYGVFVIHEDNFPWNGVDSPTNFKEVVKQTATDLMGYLNQKIKAGYTKPIFVLCHVPLNANSRAVGGEGKYSEYLVNVLNQGAAAGLNIVFLYGHCHDGGSEEFHGGEAVYYAPGDEIEILKTNSYSSSDTVSRAIGFHYLNAGYTGYYSQKGADALTMCSFDFTDSEITITRYNYKGVYPLKAAGSDEKYAYVVASPHTEPLSTSVNTKKLITKIEDSDIEVDSVTLNRSTLAMEPGDADQLAATLLPASATNKAVTWSTSNSAVATVENGRVVAVSPGEAVITAEAASGAEATCAVKVLSPSEIVRVTGVTLDKTSLELFEGDTQALVATLTPANPFKDRVKWSTSNEAVASVDEFGKVTCTGVGDAVITATTVDGGFTATCRVKVKPTLVTGITLDKTELSLVKSASTTLVAAVQPAGATNKNVTWKSSDESVAKVSATGEVTGVGDGIATVTATSEDGGFMASCQVSVKTEGIYVYPADLIIPSGQSFQYSAEVWPKRTGASVVYHCYHGGKINEETGLFEATIKGAQTEVHVNTSDWKYQSAANGKLSVEVAASSDISWSIAEGVLTVDSDVPNYSIASDAPWAKYASKVSSIVLGENVKSVGAKAFSSCTNASEITVPESASLDKDALAGLESIAVNGVPAVDCATVGHVVKVIPAVEATCTKDGLTEGSRCSRCGETLKAQEIVKAKGHKEIVIPAVPATCTENGLSEGKECSVCGAVIDAQETVVALGHNWGFWTVVKDATCTTKGSEKRVCSKDASHVEARETDMAPHDLIHHDAQAATCTEDGWDAYDACENCDYTTFEKVAATGHKEAVVPAVAPTCTETGLTEGKKCSVCGEVLEPQETVAAKGHDLVRHAAKEATTTEIGWKAYDTCKRCSYSTYEELPKIVKPDSESMTKPSVPEKIEPEASHLSTSQQEAAANEAAIAEGFVGIEATVAKAIVNSASDEGPKGTTFGRLRAKAVKATKSSIKLTWTAEKGAVKYLVYGNKCGKGKKYKLITTTKRKSFTKKSLKKKRSYKFMVVAVDAKGRVVSVSKTIHAVTAGSSKCNAVKVRTAAKKGKVTLKKARNFSLKAKAVGVAGKTVLKSHRAMKYESSNARVAKVTSKGLIKAKGKGSCYVYAYAQSGAYARVLVTVK